MKSIKNMLRVINFISKKKKKNKNKNISSNNIKFEIKYNKN